jgi:hypothetical protein
MKGSMGAREKSSLLLPQQAKTLRFIFSSTKEQKIVKTISACAESTYLLLKASKKIFVL